MSGENVRRSSRNHAKFHELMQSLKKQPTASSPTRPRGKRNSVPADDASSSSGKEEKNPTSRTSSRGSTPKDSDAEEPRASVVEQRLGRKKGVRSNDVRNSDAEHQDDAPIVSADTKTWTSSIDDAVKKSGPQEELLTTRLAKDIPADEPVAVMVDASLHVTDGVDEWFVEEVIQPDGTSVEDAVDVPSPSPVPLETEEPESSDASEAVVEQLATNKKCDEERSDAEEPSGNVKEVEEELRDNVAEAEEEPDYDSNEDTSDTSSSSSSSSSDEDESETSNDFNFESPPRRAPLPPQRSLISSVIQSANVVLSPTPKILESGESRILARLGKSESNIQMSPAPSGTSAIKLLPLRKEPAVGPTDNGVRDSSSPELKSSAPMARTTHIPPERPPASLVGKASQSDSSGKHSSRTLFVPPPKAVHVETIEEIHVDSDAASAQNSDSDSSNDFPRRKPSPGAVKAEEELKSPTPSVFPTKSAPKTPTPKGDRSESREKHKKKRGNDESRRSHGKEKKHRNSSDKRDHHRSRSKHKEREKERERDKERKEDREKEKKDERKEEKEKDKSEDKDKDEEKEKSAEKDGEIKVKSSSVTATPVSKEKTKAGNVATPPSSATTVKKTVEPSRKDSAVKKPTNSVGKPAFKASVSSKVQSQLQLGHRGSMITDVVGAILKLDTPVLIPPPKAVPKMGPKAAPKIVPVVPPPKPKLAPKVDLPPPPSASFAQKVEKIPPPSVPKVETTPELVSVTPPPKLPETSVVPSFSNAELKAILAKTIGRAENERPNPPGPGPASNTEASKPQSSAVSFWEAAPASSNAAVQVRRTLPDVISRLAAENSDSEDDSPPVRGRPPTVAPPTPAINAPPATISAELMEVIANLKSGKPLTADAKPAESQQKEPEKQPDPPASEAVPQKADESSNTSTQSPKPIQGELPPVKSIKLNISDTSMKKILADKEEKEKAEVAALRKAENATDSEDSESEGKENRPRSPDGPQITAEECWSGETVDVSKELPTFTLIENNLYLTEKKRSKEGKLICDCTLTVEELQEGVVGCGDSCLNRMLLIECGSRCKLGGLCTNKNFTQRKNAKVEVFRTSWKGLGLRAVDRIPPGTFIVEYVGEVISAKEFETRLTRMNTRGETHFYFMGLRQDQFVDSLKKGNVSRFINHSCDPNAQTEKWTVGGELRVGFFAKKEIQAGEEITFDYQLQNYGREAQKCFCGTTKCRGVLGVSQKEFPMPKTGGKDVGFYTADDDDLEEELDALCQIGVKRRETALRVARLMVRAEDLESRLCLLRLIDNTEASLQKAYLEFHCLKLIWSWMQSYIPPPRTDEDEEVIDLREEVLSVLSGFNVTHINYVEDSKVQSMLEKWCGFSIEEVGAAAAEIEKEEAPAPTSDGPNAEGFVPAVTSTTTDSRTMKLKSMLKARSEEEFFRGDGAARRSDPDMKARLAFRSVHLLNSWRTLPRLFRIPKVNKVDSTASSDNSPVGGSSPVVGIPLPPSSTSSTSGSKFERVRFQRMRSVDLKRKLLQEVFENRRKRNSAHDKDWARMYAYYHGLEQDYQLGRAQELSIHGTADMASAIRQWTLPHPSGEGVFVPDPIRCPFCVPCGTCHMVIPVMKKCKYVDDIDDADEEEQLGAGESDAVHWDDQIPVFSPPNKESDEEDDDEAESPEAILSADRDDPIPELRSPLALLQLKWWKMGKDSSDRFYFWKGHQASKWKPPLKTHMRAEILADIENADRPREKRSKLVQEIPEPSYWNPSDPSEAADGASSSRFADAGIQADAEADIVLPAKAKQVDAEAQTIPVPVERTESVPTESVPSPTQKRRRHEKSSRVKPGAGDSAAKSEPSAEAKKSDPAAGSSRGSKRKASSRDEYERLRMERKSSDRRMKLKTKRMKPESTEASSKDHSPATEVGGSNGIPALGVGAGGDLAENDVGGAGGFVASVAAPSASSSSGGGVSMAVNGYGDGAVEIPGLGSGHVGASVAEETETSPSPELVTQFKEQILDIVTRYLSNSLSEMGPEDRKKLRRNLDFKKITQKIATTIGDKELKIRVRERDLVLGGTLKAKIKGYVHRYVETVLLVNPTVGSSGTGTGGAGHNHSSHGSSRSGNSDRDYF